MLIPDEYRERYDNLAASHPWMREMLDEEKPVGALGRCADKEPDSRGKLEADVRQYANPSGGTNNLGACWEKKMLEFLDRQAAITRAEESEGWRKAASGPIYEMRGERDRALAQLEEARKLNACCQEEADEYQAVADRLRAERDGLARDLRECDENRIEFRDQRDHWQRVASEHAAEAQRLRAERKERTGAERRVLDMWPEFEDGQKVQVGDVSEFGKIGSITFSGYPRGVVVFSHHDAVIGPDEWGIKPLAGTKLKRPPLLAADDLPIEVGQVLYGESDGKAWTVTGFDWQNATHKVKGTCDGVERDLRPDWLTHEPPDSFGRIVLDLRQANCIDLDADRVREDLDKLAGRIERLAGRGL